jgi:alpha-D-ribose 1-methylphosphonate 5-triphosphate synthase subunit PhnH
MSAVPRPSEEEARANRSFDALIWALSRPGRSRDLPVPGEAAVIEALIDRECAVHAGDPMLVPLILRTGATLAPVEEADHVFPGSGLSIDALRGIRRGSDLYPDHGATLILRAAFGRGEALRLSGPGIDGATDDCRSGGVHPEGFWAWRERG